MNSIPFFKLLLTFVNAPRFIPHVLCWKILNSGVNSDIEVAMLHRNIQCKLLTGFLFLLTFDKAFRNLFYYRIGNYKYLISFLARPHDSFIIGTHTKIGNSFLGIHPFGSIVNAKSIGDNFVIRNNTIIGKGSSGIPIIGDNVEIGVNSIIIGNITIGSNVMIGAGSVITKNVPNNCVVVGNPAYIIKEKGLRINKKL